MAIKVIFFAEAETVPLLQGFGFKETVALASSGAILIYPKGVAVPCCEMGDFGWLRPP